MAKGAIVEPPSNNVADVDLIARVQDGLQLQVFPVHHVAVEPLDAHIGPDLGFRGEQVAHTGVLRNGIEHITHGFSRDEGRGQAFAVFRAAFIAFGRFAVPQVVWQWQVTRWSLTMPVACMKA